MLSQSLSFKSAYQILYRALHDGGATVGLQSTEFEVFNHRYITSPELRYVVGGLVPTVKIRAERFHDGSVVGRDELVEFVETHWALLNNETTLLGLWVDYQNGYLHLDIVENYRLQNAAERAGVARGEQAIFDAAGERSVYLCNGGESC